MKNNTLRITANSKAKILVQFDVHFIPFRHCIPMNVRLVNISPFPTNLDSYIHLMFVSAGLHIYISKRAFWLTHLIS